MNKKEVQKAISKTKHRTRKITIFIILIMLFVASSILLLYKGINFQKNEYIHYNEKSDLDYRVYLKENDYFGKYLEKDRQYIASLIDYVEANFKYSLDIQEDIKYSYHYYIEAETLVLDTNDKILYQKTDTIIPKKEYNDLKDNSFDIDEIVTLDYGYYNAIINTFISRYNLENTKNLVNLKMYVGIDGGCEEFVTSKADDAVVSMTIPLSKNTVNVDMNYKLNTGTNKLLECKKTSVLDNHFLLGGISTSLVTIFLLVYLIMYIATTRSPLTIYNNALKRIFNNYGRYISKIKTEMDYKKFQMIFVEQFEDLFEVRNSSNSPILFSQDKVKTRSVFAVPTNSKLVYIYYFSLENIEKEIDKNE